MVALIVLAWGVNHPSQVDSAPAVEELEPAAAEPSAVEAAETPAARPPALSPTTLPGGGTQVFAGNRFLVAYYGTGGTGSLGVLGETDPATMDRRLHHAAASFRRPGQPLRYVYELIVTIADAHPGPDGAYSHDIARSEVRRYIRAAHRNGALLLLDLQPGRSTFPEVAKRWEWALRDPWVGLALDPEWRMGPRQVPAHTVGQVRAAEVNRTSRWLGQLTREDALPQKLFMLHQFRVDMVQDIRRVQQRPALAMVQHVDG